ncbi:FtsB family cell division protein [Nocardioides exalbidus]|uniref:FtsB family cell division protein n=1 Tax=Nocardioides exalbidus TaxID=402596 RepID=UPI000B81B3B7|nr:septum formation initiator family protein [Nocardioides exalbidus]
MPSQRRTPRGGPGGGTRGPRQGSTTRPGDRGPRPRGATTRPPLSSGSASTRETSTGLDLRARPASPRSAARRPRFTGRAAVLVLVLAVLTVSYASSLRAYLQQRSHIGDLKAQIAEREASINDLEREKKRWDDPAYVKAQARERFGYLMPGESGFEVIGTDGKPLEAQARLNDPDDVIKTVPKAWWTGVWESVELAGNPPPPEEQPADLVDGTKKQ